MNTNSVLAKDEPDLIADEDDYVFNILELAPSQSDFVLKNSDFDSNIKLYQYEIREYNAIREDMVGKYDIIYISNGEDTTEKYKTLGDPIDKLPAGGETNGSLITNYDPLLPMYEFWPGVDFTDLTLSYIKKFIDAGQLVFADHELQKFDLANARIYEFIEDNRDDIEFKQWKEVGKEIKKETTVKHYQDKGQLRPYINLKSVPLQFDGTDSSYIDTSFGTVLTFEFDALSFVDDTTFDIKLYFDINGDNKYKESDYELLKERNNVSSSENLSLAIAIPEDFRGLQPWKFEVTDLATGAVAYQQGFMAFRGDVAIEVNVLQVACNGNTFNLGTELIDEFGNNLLTDFSEDYRINVDVITMSDYKALYNDPDFKLTEYIKPGNTKTYNMLIFGFADIYGGADITEQNIADDLKNFLDTGQSVMFTHDNLTYEVDSSGGWSRGLTRYFRDYVGQNIYSDGVMPKSGYTTLGVSDMSIERANGQGYETTTEVYASNDGIMVNYPFRILNTTAIRDFYDYTFDERKLEVAETHYQYYQLDLNNEDVVVWYTLAGGNGRNDYHDPGSYYYTYSIGNVTYSGTGHSNLSAANSFPERRLFVNTIIKAIKGANFAPEILVQGVTNGENIGRGRTTMDFSILATDPDINDEYLNGIVYLDKNDDGIFDSNEILYTYNRSDHTNGEESAIVNRVPKDVTLDLTELNVGLSKFSFKVVVSDQKGASAYKTYTFPIVESPELSFNVNAPAGLLVGDTSSVIATIGLTVPALSVEAKISDITVLSALHDTADHIAELNMISSTDYTISNYLSDYSIEGTHFKGNLSDITALTPGSSSVVRSLSYDFQAKKVGNYYIDGSISYKLDTYGISESKSSGQELKVRKGQIHYSLIDDFGAQVTSNMDAELYYFANAGSITDMDIPNTTLGTKVMDVMISGGSIDLGDESGEVLKTGYYALKVLGTSGFSGGLSRISPLDYTNHSDVVDVIVYSQPISDVEWVHANETNNILGFALLSGTRTSDSEVRFSTFKEFTDFTMSLNSSNASTYMDYNLLKIERHYGSGLTEDLTSKFKLSSEVLTWKDSSDMPIGDYVITFRHNFKSEAKGGQQASYKLKQEITVKVLDAKGAKAKRVYTFPNVNTELLKFLKSIELI